MSLDLIPGPDPGACPDCGNWLKAGMIHDCVTPDRRRTLLEAFAVAMHALSCGDWRAAGHETQERFRAAANEALIALENDGLDLLSLLPPSIRGEMPW